MTGDSALSLAVSGLIVSLTIVGPMLIASLIVGVIIGLVQALTQIQEMTLTFVPKLLILGIVFITTLPIMGSALGSFMIRVTDAVVAGG